MPKAKPPRESVFGDEEMPRLPHIPVSGINQIYETGFAGLPTTAFEDPVEKENERLKGQIADLREQLQARTSDLLVQDGTLIVHDFQLTPIGLIPGDHISPESWINLGRLLAKLEGSLQWLIGDWIVYGETIQWGDIPALAHELGFTAQTLHDYSYVARKLQFSIRIENLSFAHHRLVTTLFPEDQTKALAYAARHGLSVASFRTWIKQGMPSEGVSKNIAYHAPEYKGLDRLEKDFNQLLRHDPLQAAEYLNLLEQRLSQMRQQLKTRK